MQRFFRSFTVPLLLLVCLWTSANLNWGKDRQKYVIISDGKGYYAYLPAVFIYHDLNHDFFDSIEAKYYDGHTKYDYRTGAHGVRIDKYFCGTAWLQMPFFLLGHGVTLLGDQPADGYSKWYVIFTCLGALFYLGIGLLYLRRLLRAFGAGTGTAAFLVAVTLFGTNLFYYAIVEPTMSHVYSFAMIAMFLVYSKKWLDTSRMKYVLLSATLLGIIVLVRPVNGLVVLWLPFAAGNFGLLWRRLQELLRSPGVLVASILIFAYVVSIQFILYYLATGHFFVDAYGEEGFNLAQPELFNFLFSYKKGLFVYLPLTFVALFGFIPLWRKDRFRAAWLFIFLFVLVYVLSSWWMWYYGGSFGTRVMVEFLPLFSLLLFFLLDALKNRIAKISLVMVLVLLTLLCQVQTLQYRYYIIHWADMTQEKYWDVFLKLP